MAADAEYQGEPQLAIQAAAPRPLNFLGEHIPEYTPVLVDVQPPSGINRVAVDVCVVIDISGSMSAEATIQNAEGTAERAGLTLLDIAKHGVRTLIATLGPNDRLSLVWFNHQAGQSFPLLAMDSAGQTQASEQLDRIQAGGGTNIWLGLEQGLNSLKQDEASGRTAHVMLLTDGQTTNRDTVMTNLREYREKNEQLPGTLSTFGFGYNIDSPLLVDISNFGDATYSFIPDSGFVGTVFVNTLSNLLVTFAKEAVLNLEAEGCEIVGVHGEYQFAKTDEGVRVKLGTLQYHQHRSVVLIVTNPTGSSPQIGGNVSYITETKETKQSAFVEAPLLADGASERVVEPERLRCMFIQTTTLVSQKLKDLKEETLAEAAQAVAQFVAAVSDSQVKENEHVKALLEDAVGQMSEAVSRADWYRKWGGHYIPSLTFAHSTQQCNNFKDPGVQFYGGGLFRSILEEADKKFNELPPPQPTARSARSSAAPVPAPQDMSRFNDRYGG